MEQSGKQRLYVLLIFNFWTANDFNDNFNDLDDLLAESASPETNKKAIKNNVDSIEFDNSDDLNNIIEKYEHILN